MSTTKEYCRSYVFGLNQQIRMLKENKRCKNKLISQMELEIMRLRLVEMSQTDEILALNKVIQKCRKWYQIIIWK
jgi:hypothetical protein